MQCKLSVSMIGAMCRFLDASKPLPASQRQEPKALFTVSEIHSSGVFIGDYHEVTEPGFFVRIKVNGSGSYYFRPCRGRIKCLGSIRKVDLTIARKLAKQYRARYVIGEDALANEEAEKVVKVASAQREAFTLLDFINKRYGPHIETTNKSGAATVARLKSVCGNLLQRPLTEITTEEIERWRTKRRSAGKAISTVNRDLNALRACLNRAREWGYLEFSAVDRVKKLKGGDAHRIRYLSEAEEGRLLAALDTVKRAPHIRPAVIVSLNTGLRRGELLGLKWSDLDWQHRTLRVNAGNTKSQKTRTVPMNETVVAALQAWRSKVTPAGDATPETLPLFVFPSRDGIPLQSTKNAWRTLLQNAGISDFRWHDMRHHFCSRLVQCGVPLYTVAELAGHSSPNITQRYAHLSPSEKLAAVDLLTMRDQVMVPQPSQRMGGAA